MWPQALYLLTQLWYHGGTKIWSKEIRNMKNRVTRFCICAALCVIVGIAFTACGGSKVSDDMTPSETVSAFLDAFKAQADAVIAQAEDAHKLLDKVFKDKEALDRSDRRAQLAEEYLGCVGVLAEVIPFEAVLDEKWLGDTAWKNGKAVNELYDKAAKANEGYQTLQKKELKHKTEVVRFYCETLDLMGALQLEDELNEEDRQREEFERRQREAEAFRAERQEQRAETEAEAFAPAPEPEPAAEAATAASPEVFIWSLAMEFTGTKQFAQGVASLLKSNGLTGATIKCKGVLNG